MAQSKSILLGVAFDGRDKHKRLSWGKNFYIIGGSEKTHQMLQKKIINFNRELEKRHKSLDDLKQEEFFEIADKLGLMSR